MPKIDPTKLTKEIKNKYSVVSNAFRLSGGKKEKVKDGKPKDLIITEVGDVKQEEFYPQVKIGRWCDNDDTNEVNLSVRLIDNEIGKETLATESNKIKWSKGNKTARFYEIEPNDDYPEGAFEFDIELAKKPKTNKIGFSLNTKGVDFYYQPALTKEFKSGYSEEFKKEIIVTETDVKDLDGNVLVHRPKNVVDSYVSYYQQRPQTDTSQKINDILDLMKNRGMVIGTATNGDAPTVETNNEEDEAIKQRYYDLLDLDYQERTAPGYLPANYVGGKEYKVGKVGTIYRPEIFDATGASVWGILSIDKEAGKLTVEIPQEFLDNAVYPVVVDPTFGYTTKGDSALSVNDKQWGNLYTSAEAGTVTKISANCYNDDDLQTQSKAGIFSGVDGTLIAGSEQVMITGNGAAKTAWYDYALADTIITATNYYLMGIANDNSYTWPRTWFDDTGSAFIKSTSYAGGLITVSGFTAEDKRYSIYATYTAGGGETEKNVADSGTGTDSVSVKVLIGLSDSGSGVDATPAVRNSLTQTDGGSGTDSVSLKQIKSILDSGSGTEVLSLVIRAIIADSGSGNEIVGILTNLAMSDSGTGADAIKVLANIAITDTGAGSEAVQALARIAVSDSGSGNEALSTLIYLSVNDSGVANEAIAVLVNLAIQDAGSGSDSVSGGVKIGISETASGNDAISVLADIIVSDIGTASESVAIKTLLSVLETASGSDTVNVLSRLILQEAGSGSDIVSVIRNVLVQDAANGAELVNILMRIYAQDSGTGEDIAKILSAVLVDDSGIASEEVKVAGENKFIQDSGVGNEAVSLIARIAVNELATATESIEVVNRMFVADNGQGSDVLRVLARLAIADNATAVEAVNVAARVSVQENGTASEALAIIVSALIQEAGSAIESVKVSNPEKIISDSGMGNDKVSVILKRISIADLGSADDVVELLKRVAVSDEAIGIDVASVVANIILSDSGIGTEKIRARWDEWLCSTYKPKANPYRRKASPYTRKINPYKKCGQ